MPFVEEITKKFTREGPKDPLANPIPFNTPNLKMSRRSYECTPTAGPTMVEGSYILRLSFFDT